MAMRGSVATALLCLLLLSSVASVHGQLPDWLTENVYRIYDERGNHFYRCGDPAGRRRGRPCGCGLTFASWLRSQYACTGQLGREDCCACVTQDHGLAGLAATSRSEYERVRARDGWRGPFDTACGVHIGSH